MKAVSADAVFGAAALAGGLLLWWAGARIVEGGSSRSAPGIEEILGISCSVAGIGAIIWWILAAAAAIVAQLLTTSGHREAASIAARFSPACMRRLATAALGMNLLAVPAMAGAAPALPSSSTAQTWETAHPAGSTVWNATGENFPEVAATAEEGSVSVDAAPSWKPLPSPSSGGLVLRTDSARGPGTVVPETEVVVKPGDSLWTIAAAHLGPFATDLEVAATWPAWYEANRESIGENPSLLFPGQILRIPPAP